MLLSNVTAAAVNMAGILAALAVAGMCWSRRRQPGVQFMCTMMIMAACWSACNAFENLLPQLAVRVWFARLSFVGALAASGCYLLFALEYQGHHTSRTLRLSLFSLVLLGIILSDPWHHLFYSRADVVPVRALVHDQYGWLYWVVLAGIYVNYLTASGAMLYTIANFPRRYWRSSALILLSVSAPFLADLGFHGGWFPRGVDPTQLSMVVVGAGIYFGVVRLRTFEVTPVTQQVLFDRMSQGMLVFDSGRLLTDFNRAAEKMTGVSLRVGMAPRTVVWAGAPGGGPWPA